MSSEVKRNLAVMVVMCLALTAVLAACGARSPAGRWQVEGNPNAGLELRENGQFQGELGPAGSPRVRLEGTWTASGSAVTLAVGGALGERVPNLSLTGAIQGDVMTISPPSNVPGLTDSVTLRKQPERR